MVVEGGRKGGRGGTERARSQMPRNMIINAIGCFRSAGPFFDVRKSQRGTAWREIQAS